jgi:hypothetical protein
MTIEKMQNFYEAFKFLEEHHMFHNPATQISEFQDQLSIDVVLVNPENKTIEEDVKLNTLPQVWLEASVFEDDPEDGYKGFSLDHDLDCGGDTFEDAIIDLALRVLKKYGENPEGFGELTEEQKAEMEDFYDKLMGRKEEKEESAPVEVVKFNVHNFRIPTKVKEKAQIWIDTYRLMGDKEDKYRIMKDVRGLEEKVFSESEAHSLLGNKNYRVMITSSKGYQINFKVEEERKDEFISSVNKVPYEEGKMNIDKVRPARREENE